jgi:hypothetical protein
VDKDRLPPPEGGRQGLEKGAVRGRNRRHRLGMDRRQRAIPRRAEASVSAPPMRGWR